MVIIKEFRIPLPLTVEEYRVGQLFSVAQASKNETGGGDGVEVRENHPYKDHKEYGSGQYTHKIYHLESKVPRFVRYLAPKGSLQVHEKAWNAYPFCKTIITKSFDDWRKYYYHNESLCGHAFKFLWKQIVRLVSYLGGRSPMNEYMGEDFQLEITTWHKPGKGDIHNVHNVEEEKYRKEVEVDEINIWENPPDSYYKPEWDPRLVRSNKADRGPLNGPDWKETAEPVMCAYKMVSIHFKWRGLQNRVEKFVMKNERILFHNFHRQVVSWLDEYYGMTMDDIRKLEDQTKHELDKERENAPQKGMVAKE